MRLEAADLQFQMTDDERGLLRTVVLHPGWKIALSVLDGYVEAMTEGAERLSKSSDPFGNAERIAHSWAYVRIAEQLRARLEQGVAFELDILKMHEQQHQQDPAEDAQRRRDHFALEAL